MAGTRIMAASPQRITQEREVTRHHMFMGVTGGAWFFRSSCSCGWRSRRRWRAMRAEADLVIHQQRKRGEHGQPR